MLTRINSFCQRQSILIKIEDQADKNNTKYESNDSKRFHLHKTRTSGFFKCVYFKHWSLALNCQLRAHLKKTALKGQNDGRLTANMQGLQNTLVSVRLNRGTPVYVMLNTEKTCSVHNGSVEVQASHYRTRWEPLLQIPKIKSTAVQCPTYQ